MPAEAGAKDKEKSKAEHKSQGERNRKSKASFGKYATKLSISKHYQGLVYFCHCLVGSKSI